MNHSFFEIRQIMQGTKNLFDDNFSLFFRDESMFLDVLVEFRSIAIFKLEDHTIFIFINLKNGFKSGNVWVIKFLLYFYFSFDVSEELLSVF